MRKRNVFFVFVSLSVVVGACGSGETVETTVPMVETQSTQAASDQSSTQQPVTTSEALATGTAVAGFEVSECQAPASAVADPSTLYGQLHQAISAVVEHTNTLGAAIPAVVDFDAGWEEQVPIASAVALILADLESVEAITTKVLEDEFRANYDDELGWTFPESMWPLAPQFGMLEELATASDMYEGEIMPLLFTMGSKADAVDHWNYGASPCGMASGMVERLEGVAGLVP